ncbi:MAG TPA: DNA-directed RNA polymerase subunit omega [Terriglobia bacterium]|nr:DNA-directed RNA polymerase subunit omega [Terriglobia bacterium]
MIEFPPAVESKYRFILLAAKRARQLQAGARPLLQTTTKRPTKVAQLEVSANLVPFEDLHAEASGNGDAPAQK